MTDRVRNSDVLIAAMQEAVPAELDDVAFKMLGKSVRLYIRSNKSKPGWHR